MTLQQDSQAKYDSILTERMSAHLLNISDDILGEPTTVDHHYFRKIIILTAKYNDATRKRIANAFLGSALSNNALTMPVITDPDTLEQTQPPDNEIENVINSYMATPALLFEVFSQIL